MKKDVLRRSLYGLLTAVTIVVLSGCNAAPEDDALALGYKAIEEKDYTGALEFFNAASGNKLDTQDIYRGEGIA